MLFCAAAPVHAADLALISFAEQPVRLIRASTLYTAAQGTGLQAGDILESGPAGLQIEGLTDSTIALGPNTKVYLDRSGARIELNLLSGWLKVQRPRAAAAALAVETPLLNIDTGAGASVTHVGPAQVEVFVEDGEETAYELDKRGQPGRKLALAREQYAERKRDQPTQLAGRPAKEFIAAMPRPFFDALLPVAAKLKSAAVPRKEREVSYEDIAPWLQSNLTINKKTLAERFAQRLSDPVFNKKLSDELGQTPEWKAKLDNRERKKMVVNNVIF
jgi:hypothetical protein